MEIIQLKEATEGGLEDINALLKKLYSKYVPESIEGLRATVSDPNATAFVAKDGDKIIGMAFLFMLQTLQGRSGSVQDVIVDETYRGQGLGVRLMEAVIEQARKLEITDIELTSKPSRVAANKLYQKMGFKIRETNVYKLDL